MALVTAGPVAVPSIAAIVVGAILYFRSGRFTGPGIPDVDPLHEEAITEVVPTPAPIRAPPAISSGGLGLA